MKGTRRTHIVLQPYRRESEFRDKARKERHSTAKEAFGEVGNMNHSKIKLSADL